MLVGVRRDLVERVDDRHLRAETGERLAELEPDGAGADDQQGLGQLLELERADVVEPVDPFDAGNRRHGRSAAGRDEDALGRQLLVADANGLRVDERGRPGEHSVAGVLQ